MASSKDSLIHSSSRRDSLAMGGNSQNPLADTLSWTMLELGTAFIFLVRLLRCVSIVFNRHIPSQKSGIFSQVIRKVFLTLESFLFTEDLSLFWSRWGHTYFPVFWRALCSCIYCKDSLVINLELSTYPRKIQNFCILVS